MSGAGSNLEILAYEQSELGPVCLRRRELLAEPGTVVVEITLNSELLMSSRNTASERALSSRALAIHSGRELRVLVGGLGLGYTARELLSDTRVRQVRVVEFLPQVMSWYEQNLIPLAPELKADGRVEALGGDVYGMMWQEPSELFDLILIDVDHSPEERLGESNSRFYTPEGLERAARHLSLGGVLAVWSYAESSPFADALRDRFSQVQVESVDLDEPDEEDAPRDWLFLAQL